MRCQWPIIYYKSWRDLGQPLWGKCRRDAHYSVLGMEVCLKHAYLYRRRIHNQWIQEGILGPKARHFYYCRTSAEIKNLDTGEINQTVKEGDALSSDMRRHLVKRFATL